MKLTKKQAIEAIESLKKDILNLMDLEEFDFPPTKGKTLAELEEVFSILAAQKNSLLMGEVEQEEQEIEEAEIEQFVEQSTKQEEASETEETRLVRTALLADDMSNTVWSQTGHVINSSKSMFNRPDEEAKSLVKKFTSLLDKNVEHSLIPEEGEDRKGEKITLRKKDGRVKWSSWSKTARMLQNCSTIFKGVQVLGYDVVFPYGILIPRSQLEKLLKGIGSGETPVETIKRCLELAAKKMVDVETIDELIEIDAFMEEVKLQFSARCGELKEEQALTLV